MKHPLWINGGYINLLVNDESREVQVQCVFTIASLLDQNGDYQPEGELDITLLDEY